MSRASLALAAALMAAPALAQPTHYSCSLDVDPEQFGPVTFVITGDRAKMTSRKEVLDWQVTRHQDGVLAMSRFIDGNLAKRLSTVLIFNGRLVHSLSSIYPNTGEGDVSQRLGSCEASSSMP